MSGAKVPMIDLVIATPQDLEVLVSMVRAYHRFEGIQDTEEQIRGALGPLLEADSAHGKVWLIRHQDSVVGYAALCFGYTIEMGGPDAFLDELFVIESRRGEGIGSAALDQVAALAAQLPIKALHLEVARANDRARHLYRSKGFESREKYHLMTLTFD